MVEKFDVTSPQHWFFGSAPVVRGEDRTAYDECYKRIFAAVKPEDFLVESWANDIANLTWDIIRYRRAKADFLSVALNEAIRNLCVEPTVADKWAAGDPQVVEQLESELAKIGLSTHALMAKALVAEIEKVAFLDRLIASAEARRNTALRELERHRANLARTLRDASNDVLDAEFEDVAVQASAETVAA
jgi:hypothetical protein